METRTVIPGPVLDKGRNDPMPTDFRTAGMRVTAAGSCYVAKAYELLFQAPTY